jgi:heme-degrading monooxygenase HmoA
MSGEIIMRRWVGRIRTADEQEYTHYIEDTGLAEYRETPGNLGAQMLMRRQADGVSEVTTLSWWLGEEAIRAFAGDDMNAAKYYPEDERFLLDQPHNVDHFRVVASLPRPGQDGWR